MKAQKNKKKLTKWRKANKNTNKKKDDKELWKGVEKQPSYDKKCNNLTSDGYVKKEMKQKKTHFFFIPFTLFPSSFPFLFRFQFFTIALYIWCDKVTS